jgi:hypothetical protein
VTWTLEPVAAGTRFTFEQAGFAGLHPVFVSYILQAGSKKIYGEFLPKLLDRMPADGSMPAPAAVEEACEKGGLWRVLARIGGVLFRT